MHRAIPVGNKACADRVQKRHHDMHKARLHSIKPQVDTTVPMVCHLDHLRNNLKREQQLEERYYTIDRDNKILLQKMSEIMRTAQPADLRSKSAPVSLNRDGRKTELMRITRENQAILGRIQQAQPVYNHVAWEDSYRRSGKYLKNSAEYPIVLTKRQTSRVSLAPLGGKGGRPELSSSGGVYQPNQQQSADDLRYVLKEGKRIGETYYLVEMATDGRTLVISAYDGESQRTRDLVVSEKNHRRLFREANGDYNVIAESLFVDGDQLRLATVEGEPSNSDGLPSP